MHRRSFALPEEVSDQSDLLDYCSLLQQPQKPGFNVCPFAQHLADTFVDSLVSCQVRERKVLQCCLTVA